MIGIDKYIKVALDTSGIALGSNNGSNVIFVEALQNMNKGIQYESLVQVTNTTDIDSIFDSTVPNNTAPQFHNAFKNQFVTGNNMYYVCAIDPNESEAVYRGGDLPDLYQLFELAGYTSKKEEEGEAITTTKGILYGPGNVKYIIFSDIELNINITNSEAQTSLKKYMIPGSVLHYIYRTSKAQYYNGFVDTEEKQAQMYDDYQQIIALMTDINNQNSGVKFGVSSSIRVVNGVQKTYYQLVVGTTDKGENTKINFISISEIAQERGSQIFCITKLDSDKLNAATNLGGTNQEMTIKFKDSAGAEKTADVTILNANKVETILQELKVNNAQPLIDDINASLLGYTNGDASIQNFINNLRVSYAWYLGGDSIEPTLYFLFTTISSNLTDDNELMVLMDKDATADEPEPKILEIMGLMIETKSDPDLTNAKSKGLIGCILYSTTIEALQGGIVFNMAPGVSKNISGHGDLIENEKIMQFVKSLCDESTVEPTHMVISRTLTYDELMNSTDTNKLKKIANSFDKYMNDICMLVLQTNDMYYNRDDILGNISSAKIRNIVMIYDPNVGNYVDGALVKFLSSINYFIPGQARNLLGLTFENGISACNISTSQMEAFDQQRINAYALLSTGQAMFQTGYTSDIAAIPYIDMANGINNLIRVIRNGLMSEILSGKLTIDQQGREKINMIVSAWCDFYVSSGLLGDTLVVDALGNETFLPAYQVSVGKITYDHIKTRTFPEVYLVIHCRAYANSIKVTIRESTNSVITTTITE